MYRFLENFETGIPFIDNGHRRLLADMEEARQALEENHEDDFHRMSAQLLDTMQEHIAKQHIYEEEIMGMSHDPELAEQKEAHAHFRTVIDQHRTSLNWQNDYEELTALMNFLNEWFLQHILSSDMLIASAQKKAKAATMEAKAKAAKAAKAAERETPHASDSAATAVAPTANTADAEESRAEAPEEKPAPKGKTAPARRKAAAAGESGADGTAPTPKAEKQKKTAAKAAPKAKAAAAKKPATETSESTPPKNVPQPGKPAKAAVIKKKSAPADPFAFTDEFRTQIPLVDKEHETLFDLVRQTYELVHDEFRIDKFDDIVAIIGELRDYTIKHFADEERYMKSINYDGLAEQVKAHTAFVEQLNNIDLDDIDAHQEEALDKLIKFLLNWLVQHILKIDKKMPYIEEAAEKLTE